MIGCTGGSVFVPVNLESCGFLTGVVGIVDEDDPTVFDLALAGLGFDLLVDHESRRVFWHQPPTSPLAPRTLTLRSRYK